MFPALRIFATLLLVALNGLFVAAEFSLVKIRATQVNRLVEEARRSAGLVKEAPVNSIPTWPSVSSGSRSPPPWASAP